MGNIYRLFTDPSCFPVWGTSGCALVLAGCAVPLLKYRGRMGQRYSPLNHFISELGERQVSEYARVFNASLVLAGFFFVMFMVQFGLFIGGPAAIAAIATGVFSSVACSMVGIFPMDTMEKHDYSAMCFFYGGFATILLFGVNSLFDPRSLLPLPFIFFAAAVALVFAAFILIPVLKPKKPDGLDMFGADRPSIWALPVIEWIAMMGMIGWIAAVSLYFI